MKITLSNELAYLVGLWKARPSLRGLGVSGSGEASEIFMRETLAQKLVTPEKIVVGDREAYFFHTAYKNFFGKIVREQIEIFHKRNAKAAHYLAGFFDGCGGVNEFRGVFLTKTTASDEMLLERLGFRTKYVHGKLFIQKPEEFIQLIKPFLKHSVKNKL